MVRRFKHRFHANCTLTPSNCLSGGVKVTKNADADKYEYSGYGLECNARSHFLLPDGSSGRMTLFLELIIVLQCILTIKRRIS